MEQQKKPSRSAQISLKVFPKTRERLTYLAELDHRSVNNLIEMLIEEFINDKNNKLPAELRQ